MGVLTVGLAILHARDALRFRGPDLVAAIGATFAKRGVPIPAEPPVAFSSRYSEAPEKVPQWKAFLKRGRLRAAVSPLPELVETSARFVLDPLRAAAQTSHFIRRWPAVRPWQP